MRSSTIFFENQPPTYIHTSHHITSTHPIDVVHAQFGDLSQSILASSMPRVWCSASLKACMQKRDVFGGGGLHGGG